MTPALRSLIVVTLIGYMGTALPYPIFAPMFLGEPTAMAESSYASPIWLFAALMAIYPAGTLWGSLYLGSLSDRIGRRTVLVNTLVLAMAANTLAAVAIGIGHYELLFLARFLTGFFEGNISVARAIVGDSEMSISKAEAFGYLSSTGYAGYLLGPLVGATLSSFGYSTPFLAAAALCALAAVACIVYVERDKPTVVLHSEPQAEVGLWRQTAVKRILAIQFAITMAINVYHEFFPALMVTEWDASPAQISYATVVATVTMVSLSIFGMRYILRRFEVQTLYGASMLMLGLSLMLFVAPQQLLYVYPVFIIFGISLAIFNSSSNAWLSDRYSDVAQGKLMGVVGSMFFASNVVAALVGGLVASLSVKFLMLLGGFIAIASCAAYAAIVRRNFPEARELSA